MADVYRTGYVYVQGNFAGILKETDAERVAVIK